MRLSGLSLPLDEDNIAGMAAAVATRWLAVPFAPVIGIEHEAREAMPDGGDTRRYGDTAITLYRTE